MNNTNQKNLKPHSLVQALVDKAAVVTGYSKEAHLTKRELATETIKQNIISELNELDVTLRFTEYLVDEGHPDPAAWLPVVFHELPNQTPGEWKKQIHQFARYWILYLISIHSEQVDTSQLRIQLAKEDDPFVWLGHLEKNLAPFICENKLFMTEEQAASYTPEVVKTFEITSEGAQEVPVSQLESELATGVQGRGWCVGGVSQDHLDSDIH